MALIQAAYYEHTWSDYVGGVEFGFFAEYHYNRFAKLYNFDKNTPYRNLQFFNLGLQPSLMDNRDYVIQVIDSLVKKFDLILIQVGDVAALSWHLVYNSAISVCARLDLLL